MRAIMAALLLTLLVGCNESSGPPAMPDLVVEKLDADSTSAAFTVQNIGDAGTGGPCRAVLIAGDALTLVLQVPKLQPGARSEFVEPLSLMSGEHVVMAIADSHDEITEWREDNNASVTKVTVP